MKGILFTEFLEFADCEFGAQTTARLVATGGRAAADRYLPAGQYDHAELLELAEQLAAIGGVTRADLLRRFGRALFAHFVALYPVFLAGAESALAFLADVDTYVHGELLKLYPDAQFPEFECRRLDTRRLEMTYRSERRLADLAQGLIEGCIAHFGEEVAVRREDLGSGDGTVVRFELVAGAGQVEE